MLLLLLPLLLIQYCQFPSHNRYSQTDLISDTYIIKDLDIIIIVKTIFVILTKIKYEAGLNKEESTSELLLIYNMLYT